MSASAISITANRMTTRRTAVSAFADPNSGDPNSAASTDPSTPIAAAKKPQSPTTIPTARRTHRKSLPARSPPRPRWVTIASVLAKNLLLVIVLIGLVQMVRRLIYNTDREGFTVNTGAEFERRIADVEGLLKKTTKLLQVQVEVVDKKLEKGLNEVRKDLKTEIEEKNKKLMEKIDKFDMSIEGLERELKNGNWLKKEDINILIEEYRKKNGGVGDVGLDEVREVAREIVERELERFAADGLGKVDYAVASGGGVVVRHSEEYGVGRGIGWFKRVKNGIHDDSMKMISPSFGEPGQCFPLKGSSGFVQIKLRSPIVPEAVTLEHVAKSVAFDRSSAPKDCQIYGRLHKPDIINQGVDTGKMILLTEFTYDLEKSNAQTFDVVDTPIVVDTIRFNFTSNHGSPAHTCIYRLRVHGRQAESIPMLDGQS